MRSSVAVRAAVAGAALLVVPAVAEAAVSQRAVTSQNAVSYTPRLLRSGAERPRVDALRVVGSTAYAAGRFDSVRQGGTTYRGLRNIMAFDKNSGRVDPRFDTRFNGPVRTLEAAPGGGLFAGGAFTKVDGRSQVGLVRLRTDGSVVRSFRPYFGSGTVNDLELATVRGERRLLVAGTMKGRLAAVDVNTGARTSLLDAAFTGKIPGARGTGTAVFDVAVSPDGRRLIATGDFTTVRVDGVSRARRAFVMLDMPDVGREATIDPWYYPGFRKECSAADSGDARRIANLQGVDWSPTGSHFNVTATGKISRGGDVWHRWASDAANAASSVCDAVGRFALADDRRPVWINYTGGDSLWRG